MHDALEEKDDGRIEHKMQTRLEKRLRMIELHNPLRQVEIAICSFRASIYVMELRLLLGFTAGVHVPFCYGTLHSC